MKPVNILSYKYDPKAKFGCTIQLRVDDFPLVDLLEGAIPEGADVENWREKEDALLLKETLFSTLKEPGLKDILTCAGCHRPDDILLDGFLVIHEGDFIIWSMHPPGYQIFFSEEVFLRFKFHRPQYEKVVNEIMKIKQ